MKTGKLVIGILSIVLFLLVSLQSCAAGLANTLAENGEVSGSAGFVLALGLLVAGIVNICTRKGGKGGYVAAGFHILPALFALPSAGSYSDLYIWAALSIAFGVFTIIATKKRTACDISAAVGSRPWPGALFSQRRAGGKKSVLWDASSAILGTKGQR